MSLQVLIIEDDQNISEILSINLNHAGIICFKAENTQCARIILNSNHINIIILDWMLPKQSGFSFIKELKKNPNTKNIHILMLTAKQAEEEIIASLEAGADDYIIKPFSPKQIVAKIKTIARRFEFNDIYTKSYITINNKTKNAYLKDKNTNELVTLKLSHTEFKLLLFFITHSDRVYSRQEILNYVWNDHGYIDERTVDVQVKRLRHVINAVDSHKICTNLIETIRGFGYKFNTI